LLTKLSSDFFLGRATSLGASTTLDCFFNMEDSYCLGYRAASSSFGVGSISANLMVMELEMICVGFVLSRDWFLGAVGTSSSAVN
jgi:hypothetical protein